MSNKRFVSLKDLAEELGVSISTVSRALRGSKEISREVRKKVVALARKRNYRPNPFAMGLLKSAPRIIGIIVPDLVTHFYSSIISGINDLARENGYSVIITSASEQYELEKRCVSDLVNIRVEGIIACLSQETTEYRHFERLAEQNIPLVLFDRICLPALFSSVIVDNVESARRATLHLLDEGAKRVAFIAGANHLEIVKERKHGYLEALRERGIPIDRELVRCQWISYQYGYESTGDLLALPNPPDAILSMSDSLAFGAMKAIREHGLSIPGDVALIGYTDELHANYVEPALTAVEHQTYEMGKSACGLLLDQLRGNKKPKQVVIPTLLTVRNSSPKNLR